MKDFTHCAVAAVLLGLFNAFSRPMLESIFAPITSISYALSLFLINATLLWVVGNVAPGVVITGFTPALLASVVLTTINTGLDAIIHQPVLV